MNIWCVCVSVFTAWCWMILTFIIWFSLQKSCDLPTIFILCIYQTHIHAYAYAYSHQMNVFPCKRISDFLCACVIPIRRWHIICICACRITFFSSFLSFYSFFLLLFLTQFYANQILISGDYCHWQTETDSNTECFGNRRYLILLPRARVCVCVRCV